MYDIPVLCRWKPSIPQCCLSVTRSEVADFGLLSDNRWRRLLVFGACFIFDEASLIFIYCSLLLKKYFQTVLSALPTIGFLCIVVEWNFHLIFATKDSSYFLRPVTSSVNKLMDVTFIKKFAKYTGLHHTKLMAFLCPKTI